MAAKRLWSSLSPAYRKRLAASGVTAREYNRGVIPAGKRTKARGHAKTPEHPERAAKQPERYPEYVTKRKLPRSDPRYLRDEMHRIGKRIERVGGAEAAGIDKIILAAIPPEERENFIHGWNDAHDDYEKKLKAAGSFIAYGQNGGSAYGRKRLDIIESSHPAYPRALGFYH